MFFNQTCTHFVSIPSSAFMASLENSKPHCLFKASSLHSDCILIASNKICFNLNLQPISLSLCHTPFCSYHNPKYVFLCYQVAEITLIWNWYHCECSIVKIATLTTPQ